MDKEDIKAWYVMLHTGSALAASTVFLFLHPEVFAIWVTFVGSVGAAFHWMIIKEDKVPDVRVP